MAITKEEVVAKATELSLTLTDEQIAKHVTEQKLPEKQENKVGTTIEELLSKHSPRQLAEMLQDTRSEAAERRRENKTLKEQAEAVTAKIADLEKVKGQVPEFEAKMTELKAQLQGVKDAEKKRRELAFAKLDEKKRATFDYLVNVDTISADKFDATIESLAEVKSNGTESHTPAGDPPGGKNPFDKKTLNLAEQIRLKRENPTLYEKLSKAAG